MKDFEFFTCGLEDEYGRVPTFFEMPDSERQRAVYGILRKMYLCECVFKDSKRLTRRIRKSNGDGKVSRKWLRKQLLAVADKEFNARQIDAQLDRIRENMTYAAWWKHFSTMIMWDQLVLEVNRKRGSEE